MDDWRCACTHPEYMHGIGGCGSKNGHDVYCWCTIEPTESAIEFAKRLDRILRVPCKTHGRYQLKRAPRTACSWCWRMWIKLHPDQDQ